MIATTTRPEHHAARPSRSSIADGLYTYNCLGEHLIEHNGRLMRFHARRPSWKNRRDAATLNTLTFRS